MGQVNRNLINAEGFTHFVVTHFQRAEYGSIKTMVGDYLEEEIGITNKKTRCDYMSDDQRAVIRSATVVASHVLTKLRKEGYLSKFSRLTWRKEKEIPPDVFDQIIRK